MSENVQAISVNEAFMAVWLPVVNFSRLGSSQNILPLAIYSAATLMVTPKF